MPSNEQELSHAGAAMSTANAEPTTPPRRLPAIHWSWSSSFSLLDVRRLLATPALSRARGNRVHRSSLERRGCVKTHFSTIQSICSFHQSLPYRKFDRYLNSLQDFSHRLASCYAAKS